MKLNKLIVLPILTAAFALSVAAPKANAATSSDTIVNLQMNDYASITATGEITVTPTLEQIVAGSVTTINNPITLTISSTQGAEVTIAGSGGTLADEDLELKAGAGAWVGAEDSATLLYSSLAAQNETQVPVNVRITNLGAYDLGTYTNTVTFTVTDAE